MESTRWSGATLVLAALRSSLRAPTLYAYGSAALDALATLLAFVLAICVDAPALASHVRGQLALATLTAIAAATVCTWAIYQFDLDRDGRLRMFGIMAGTLLTSLGARLLVPSFSLIPPSALLLGAILSAFSCECWRVVLVTWRARPRVSVKDAVPTIVVGSRDAAAGFINVTARKRDLGLQVVGCVDEQTSGPRCVAGVPILGSISGLPGLIRRYHVEVVVIAVAHASDELINSVEAACTLAADCTSASPIVRVIPGVSALLRGHGQRVHRDLRAEDLLHRETSLAELTSVRPYIESQVVLVTGAGGSIGSEISRQAATLNPRQLILLGHGENSLFHLDQELRVERKFDMTKVVLADITDSDAIRKVFSTYRPNIVFHAAAHKHVPGLEQAPCEAVRNNVFGTQELALAAAASGVAKFILLSSDKAVNPTSVMGATKRVAELVCQSIAHRTMTEFVCVRFGNVLGSRGSVLPTFLRQVERGGPVTITHHDIERYFMTIPEAVSLVLQAMSIGRDGQVFVLDMGKPVKLVDLAERVIRLSGYIPYREINIVEVGIRPGEKLFEEILTVGEGMAQTRHERLFIAEQERLEYSELAGLLQELRSVVRLSDWQAVVRILSRLVPTYTPGLQFREAFTTGTADDAARNTDAAELRALKSAEVLRMIRHTLPPEKEEYVIA